MTTLNPDKICGIFDHHTYIPTYIHKYTDTRTDRQTDIHSFLYTLNTAYIQDRHSLVKHRIRSNSDISFPHLTMGQLCGKHSSSTDASPFAKPGRTLDSAPARPAAPTAPLPSSLAASSSAPTSPTSPTAARAKAAEAAAVCL